MEKQQYDIMAQVETTHWWFCAKRKFISSLIPKPKQKLHILDIGSGTGGTSKFLSQWGKVTGVEQSPFAAPYLKKRHISFVQTSINTYTPRKKFFHLVCLLDVLYHKNIKNDVAVLRKAYAALRPGGILCITDCALPLFTSYHDIIMHARERYYLRSLVSKVERVGFTIHRASYIYFFTFPLFVILRLLNKFIPFPTVTKGTKFMNQLLSMITNVEAKILRFTDLPIGSSVIIVARKPFS